MDPFSTLFGGGLSLSGGAGGAAGPATSGNTSTGQAVSTVNAYQYASPFVVSGQGAKVNAESGATQTPNASASAAASNGNNIALYIALGIAGLAVLVSLRRAQ